MSEQATQKVYGNLWERETDGSINWKIHSCVVERYDFIVKDIIIFGAGKIGQLALLKYADRTDYFIDNDIKIQGQKINGIIIKSVEAAIPDIEDHYIIIASKQQMRMAEQLKKMGIDKYSFYLRGGYKSLL